MSMEETLAASEHERGRMTEQLRNLTLAVQGMQAVISDMTKNFATQRDLDRVETTANTARDNASRANARIDSFSTWEKIGVAIIVAALLIAMKFKT